MCLSPALFLRPPIFQFEKGNLADFLFNPGCNKLVIVNDSEPGLVKSGLSNYC